MLPNIVAQVSGAEKFNINQLIKINGQPIEAIADCDAYATIVSEELCTKFNWLISNAAKMLSGAVGEPIGCVDSIMADIEILMATNKCRGQNYRSSDNFVILFCSGCN